MLLNNDALLKGSVQEAARYLTSTNYEVEQDGSDADEKSSSVTHSSAKTPQTAPPSKSANPSDDKKDANSGLYADIVISTRRCVNWKNMSCIVNRDVSGSQVLDPLLEYGDIQMRK